MVGQKACFSFDGAVALEMLKDSEVNEEVAARMRLQAGIEQASCFREQGGKTIIGQTKSN